MLKQPYISFITIGCCLVLFACSPAQNKPISRNQGIQQSAPRASRYVSSDSFSSSGDQGYYSMNSSPINFESSSTPKTTSNYSGSDDDGIFMGLGMAELLLMAGAGGFMAYQSGLFSKKEKEEGSSKSESKNSQSKSSKTSGSSTSTSYAPPPQRSELSSEIEKIHRDIEALSRPRTIETPAPPTQKPEPTYSATSLKSDSFSKPTEKMTVLDYIADNEEVKLPENPIQKIETLLDKDLSSGGLNTNDISIIKNQLEVLKSNPSRKNIAFAHYVLTRIMEKPSSDKNTDDYLTELKLYPANRSGLIMYLNKISAASETCSKRFDKMECKPTLKIDDMKVLIQPTSNPRTVNENKSSSSEDLIQRAKVDSPILEKDQKIDLVSFTPVEMKEFFNFAEKVPMIVHSKNPNSSEEEFKAYSKMFLDFCAKDGTNNSPRDWKKKTAAAYLYSKDPCKYKTMEEILELIKDEDCDKLCKEAKDSLGDNNNKNMNLSSTAPDNADLR